MLLVDQRPYPETLCRMTVPNLLALLASLLCSAELYAVLGCIQCLRHNTSPNLSKIEDLPPRACCTRAAKTQVQINVQYVCRNTSNSELR